MARPPALRRRNRRQLAALAVIAAVVIAFPHVFRRGQTLVVGQSSASAFRQLSLAGARDVTNGISWFRYVRAKKDGDPPARELASETHWYSLADGTGLCVRHEEDAATGEMRLKNLWHYPDGLGFDTGGAGSAEPSEIELPQAPIWLVCFLR